MLQFSRNFLSLGIVIELIDFRVSLSQAVFFGKNRHPPTNNSSLLK